MRSARAGASHLTTPANVQVSETPPSNEPAGPARLDAQEPPKDARLFNGQTQGSNHSAAIAAQAFAPTLHKGAAVAGSELQKAFAGALDAHVDAVIAALGDKNSFVVDGKRSASGALDVDALKNGSHFSLLLDGPKADDALVAAGVALAHGVPSLYIVPERKHLPWFLREADQTFPGTVRILEEPIASAVKKKLRADKPELYGPRASTTDGATNKVDTFIGCLMSGLTETQYAEGRGHLMAIDEALRGKLGDRATHCEGIMVASTTSFGTPKESLAMDMNAIRGADRCVFYLYDGQPRPSGMWVEAGVAIGLDKPCTFLVPSEDALPPSLRDGARPKNVRVVVYSDHASLATTLAQKPESLLGAATPRSN